MKPIRVGVVGLGSMGLNHCRVYSTLRTAEFVGVYDTNNDLNQIATKSFHVLSFPDVGELLNSVDAISLVTPTPSHFHLAKQCLDAGIHVLIEKPITETVSQAEELCAIAEANGTLIMVGHIERFNPTYRELKNLLEHKHVLAIDINRLSPFEGSNTDVDVIFDLFVHDADLLMDLIGREPQTIHASGVTALSGVVDHLMTQIVFENGPIVSATSSRVTEEKIRRIDVTALEAYIEADLLNKSLLANRRTIGEYINVNRTGVKYRQESIVERIHVPNFEPLQLELSHFIECVRGETDCIVPVRDGLRALRLTEAVYEKAMDDLIYMPVEIETIEHTSAERIGTE